jgi:hypothetical protein
VDVTRCDVFSLGASVYELCLGRFLGAEGEEGSAEWHAIRSVSPYTALCSLYECHPRYSRSEAASM